MTPTPTPLPTIRAPHPAAAHFSLGREIRIARRDAAFARTDAERARTIRRLEALRMTEYELRRAEVAA